jgi:hypothetical protein
MKHKTETFWDRVEKCNHEYSPNYYYWIGCTTPYCDGGGEQHCLKCGVYIYSCQCRCEYGMSGWSHKRWKTYWKKRHKNV